MEDVAGYVAQVTADKFGSSVTGVDDLRHGPQLVWNEKSQEMEEKPSELLMLVMTLWDRLQTLRRKQGDCGVGAYYGGNGLVEPVNVQQDGERPDFLAEL